MNIGQRVKRRDGTIGRILAVDGTVGKLVEFIDWHEGHGGNTVNGINIPDSNSCWWINEEHLEVLNFHPGDIVYTWALPRCIREVIPHSQRLTNAMCEHLYVGVVLEIRSNMCINTLVEFDSNYTSGHDGHPGRAIGRINGCRWINSGELKLHRVRGRYRENLTLLANDKVIVDADYESDEIRGKIGRIPATFSRADEHPNVIVDFPGEFPGTFDSMSIPLNKLCWIPTMENLNVYRTQILSAREHSTLNTTTTEVEVEVEYEHTKEIKKAKEITCSMCGHSYLEDGGMFDLAEASPEKIKAIEELLGKKFKHLCYYCANKFKKCNECDMLQDLRDGARHAGAVWVRESCDSVLICEKCEKKLRSEITICVRCEELVFEDSVEWEDDEPYCPGCFNAQREEETDIYDYQRGKDGYKILPFTTFTKLPQRNYGVEIETHCEEGNSISKDYIRPWLRYEDGSLGYNGEEFASPIFAGDAGLREIEKLLKMLKENHYYVEGDCAVHCHVDAKDYKFRDVRRFLLFMHDFEPIIYSFLRRPCGGGVPTLKQLVGRDKLRRVSGWKKLKQALYGRCTNLSPHSKWGDIRYRGLNVHSYFFRKTFEFRYLGKTMYTGEICNFARFAVFTVENGRFYKTTKKVTKPTLKEMAHVLQFPKDLHEYLVESQKKHDDSRGILRAEGERK